MGRVPPDLTALGGAAQGTAAGQADLLARAELLLGGYQHAADFFNRLRDVSVLQVRLMSDEYMRRIQFAYLGDTARMYGHW